MMQVSLPGKRFAAFGDTKAHKKPGGTLFAALANANQNAVFQWFYQNNPPKRPSIFDLTWYDQNLQATPPGDDMLVKTYTDMGGIFISRTSWSWVPENVETVVYGKYRREDNHDDNDVGQVCLDGYGKRLIIDPGSPRPGYPADYWGAHQWKYYNRSSYGHNLVAINNQELIPLPRDQHQGKLLDHQQNNAFVFWQFDLSEAYQTDQQVKRTVIHYQPNIMMVIDQVKSSQPTDTLSLRWHATALDFNPNTGQFMVENDGVKLTAICSSNQAMQYQKKKQVYTKPYNTYRLGDPLEDLNIHFLESKVISNENTFVSLFYIQKPQENEVKWIQKGKWNYTLNGASTSPLLVQVKNGKIKIKQDGETSVIKLPLD